MLGCANPRGYSQSGRLRSHHPRLRAPYGQQKTLGGSQTESLQGGSEASLTDQGVPLGTQLRSPTRHRGS